MTADADQRGVLYGDRRRAGGIRGNTLGEMPDVFVPLSMRETIQQGWKGLDDRRNYWVYLFARLKPGVSREQAQAAMNPLFHGIIQEVDLPLQKGNSDRYRQQFGAQVMTLEPGAHGAERGVDGGYRADEHSACHHGFCFADRLREHRKSSAGEGRWARDGRFPYGWPSELNGRN